MTDDYYFWATIFFSLIINHKIHYYFTTCLTCLKTKTKMQKVSYYQLPLVCLDAEYTVFYLD